MGPVILLQLAAAVSGLSVIVAAFFGLLVLLYSALARACGDVLDCVGASVWASRATAAGEAEDAAAAIAECVEEDSSWRVTPLLTEQKTYLRRVRYSRCHYAEGMVLVAGVGGVVGLALLLAASMF